MRVCLLSHALTPYELTGVENHTAQLAAALARQGLEVQVFAPCPAEGTWRLAQRLEEPGDAPDDRYPRALQMFATHNRFTADDWRWILAQGRYDIVAAASTHARARAWLAKPI